LYQCGKVCLSLLGTWQGPGWESGQSTLLQVLVSIQGLILVPDPYYNEPGYEHGRGSPAHEKASATYSANIRRYTLQHAIGDYLATAAAAAQAISHPQPPGSGSGSVPPPAAPSVVGSSSGSGGPTYPEFGTVMVRHFAVKAKALEEQLREWTALDSSLTTLANTIRKHLAIVVQAYEREQHQKPAARREPETIVLE
jgi:Ubiquitin-conjugating enzyme